MRMIFGLVLVAGLGLAGFAVYMVKSYVGQTEAALRAERAARAQAVPTVPVMVVNKPIAFGAPLTPADVQVVSWPKNALPDGVFADLAALFPEAGKNRTVVRPMEKFEPVLAVKVTAPGEDAGLTTRLGRGMRAFAIKVDVASGVSGFLRPEDRVDIYWTGLSPNGDGEITRLIETGVRIVAVDQTADAERSTGAMIARTVTVESSPQQVATLAQAQATGRLALSLVGVGDTETSRSVEVTRRDLLGLAAESAVVATQEKVCTIRTRRGADVMEMPIPCTN
ncbi:MAG: Flp pilus assembly protein CpaB [Gemmobacter sp.]